MVMWELRGAKSQHMIVLHRRKLSVQAEGKVEGSVNGCSLFGTEDGQLAAQTLLGDGGKGIQVNNTGLGQSVLRTQGDFRGNITNPGSQWGHDYQIPDRIGLITRQKEYRASPRRWY
jgi:hypothetical protein